MYLRQISNVNVSLLTWVKFNGTTWFQPAVRNKDPNIQKVINEKVLYTTKQLYTYNFFVLVIKQYLF